VVGFLATLITMSGFGDHHPGLRDHDDRNAQYEMRSFFSDQHTQFQRAFLNAASMLPI
jgi:hypothetical protein